MEAPADPRACTPSTSLLWSLTFLCASMLQLNDPDPALWCLGYALPALYHAYHCRLQPQPMSAALRACFQALPAALLALSLYHLRSVPPSLLLTAPLKHEHVREAIGMAVALLSMAQADSPLLLYSFLCPMLAWILAGIGCI